MTSNKPLRVLVATDGSAHARGAVTTAIRFPWPPETKVFGITARVAPLAIRRSIVLTALDRSAGAIAESARRKLARRWPDAAVTVVDEPPVPAILAEADRRRADVIVIGWRGYGALGALLMGSVSRGVVRHTKGAVLVVKRRPTEVRRLVVGLNESPNARRAVELVARLQPPRGGGDVTLFAGVEPARVPTQALATDSVRGSVMAEVARINARRVSTAKRRLAGAARMLSRAGWRVHTALGSGPPLRDLLDTVRSANADLLVVGAGSTSGIKRVLLGSVAEGALSRSPVPVLIVR